VKIIIAALIIMALTIWGVFYVKTMMEKNMENYTKKIEAIK